jgi:hypothetical protein
MNNNSRINEWYVPRFGPLKFRVLIGLLFLPYTGMCTSFVIWGSLIFPNANLERVLAIFTIYFLSLGIGAHFADYIGSKKKPWSNVFSKKQSLAIITASLSISYLIGMYYIIYFAPLLLVVAVIETFFLFAYNFELFKGFFHKDFWFSISWGMLPFIAGFVIQSNTVSIKSLLVSLIPFALSYIEIKVSRSYKAIKRKNQITEKSIRHEKYLKVLSLGTISFTVIWIMVEVTNRLSLLLLLASLHYQHQ